MKIDKSLISGSTTMLILKLLETNDMYGYKMIEELERLSENVFTLKAGTLYPLLHNLEQKNMIESYTKLSENERSRKYYKITRQGQTFLKEKKSEWNAYISTVNKVLGGFNYAIN
ncbi:MAG: helix-turn-helix transcriptional regulator [Clostridiales bacterium]